MKLKSKVLLAQAPLGLFIFIMCLLFIFTTAQIRKSTSNILEQNYKSITALENMRMELDSIDSSFLSIAAKNYESKDIILRTIEVSIKNFSEQLEIQENNLDIQGEKENTQILVNRWEIYKSETNKILGKVPLTLNYSEYAIILKPSFLAVKEAINLITELNQDEVFYRTETINSMIRLVGQIIVIFTLATFLIGILASAMLTNKIMQPLTVLTRLVRDISNGKMGLKLDVSGNDEVAELGIEFNMMIKNLEEYRKSSIGEIIKAKDFLKLSIDTLPDPIFVFSPEMTVLSNNFAATKMFDLTQENIFLDDLPALIRDKIKKIINHIVHNIDSTIPASFQKPILYEQGPSTIELIPIAHPMIAPGKGLIGISILFRNITSFDLKGYIKAERIVTLTHEFLSPLNSAQTAIHICLEKIIGDLNSKQIEFLSLARDDCYKVKRMITNLQDLDRFDSLTQEASLDEIQLENLIAQAIQDIEVLAVNKEIIVHKELIHSIDKVKGNSEQLLLAFKNILDNALLHTPKSGIIKIRMKERSKDFLCFIQNTGSFVPEEVRNKLFDKFYTIPSDEVKGDGIGLYIAKQIVTQHKGTIGVKSSRKLGTTFWIKIPKLEKQT